MASSLTFLARLALPNDVRWLAYHHGYTAENLKMRLYNQLNRWLLPAADVVVTVCNLLQRCWCAPEFSVSGLPQRCANSGSWMRMHT